MGDSVCMKCWRNIDYVNLQWVHVEKTTEPHEAIAILDWCAFHDAKEVQEEGDDKCAECGHVFKPGELLQTFNEQARINNWPLLNEDEKDKIHACPLCTNRLD